MKSAKNNPPASQARALRAGYLIIAILFLSFLGFLIATYLTILHYKNALPPCAITHGCETVLTSKFATVFGVPLALFGSLFYTSVIAACILFYHNSKKIFAKAIFLIACWGIFVSIVLFYIQLAIIKNFCQYCVLTEIINFLIFLLSYSLLKKGKNKEAKEIS